MSIKAMKLALEALKMCRGLIRNNIEKGVAIESPNPFFSADVDIAITSLRQAIEQPEQAQPVAQLMDMIVGNLVREGVNKHRARELADHFIKQSNYTNGYCTVRTDLLKEQAEKSEPVATMWQHGETGRTRITTPDSITDCDARWFKVSDLYASPPQRQPWVGLTNEDKQIAFDDTQEGGGFWEFADAIEATLRKKNHG
jgi:hypothetical protein